MKECNDLDKTRKKNQKFKPMSIKVCRPCPDWCNDCNKFGQCKACKNSQDVLDKQGNCVCKDLTSNIKVLDDKERGTVIIITYPGRIDVGKDDKREEKMDDLEERNGGQHKPDKEEMDGVMHSWGIDRDQFEIFRGKAERIMNNEKCQLKWNMARSMGEFDKRLDEEFYEEKEEKNRKDKMCKAYNHAEFLTAADGEAAGFSGEEQGDRQKIEGC
ncbi:MAG: hypothetical protein COA94_08255 [Rickettsiales bacterium]|nr:MAG: hypothetical protein COA94_08255 [Rickettsiales bacterium]